MNKTDDWRVLRIRVAAEKTTWQSDPIFFINSGHLFVPITEPEEHFEWADGPRRREAIRESIQIFGRKNARPLLAACKRNGDFCRKLTALGPAGQTVFRDLLTPQIHRKNYESVPEKILNQQKKIGLLHRKEHFPVKLHFYRKTNCDTIAIDLS